MAKRVIFVRHGESEAQVTKDRKFRRSNPALLDCRISKKGRKDALRLSNQLRAAASAESKEAGSHSECTVAMASAELVVVSPLTRALQTCCIAFKHQRGVPIICHPDVAECGSIPENTGRPLQLLQRDPILCSQSRWADIDFALVPAQWGAEGGEQASRSRSGAAEAQRVKGFRYWLARRPERSIVVVGHMNVFGKVVGQPGRRFANCVPQTFTLTPDAVFTEGWAGGGGSGDGSARGKGATGMGSGGRKDRKGHRGGRGQSAAPPASPQDARGESAAAIAAIAARGGTLSKAQQRELKAERKRLKTKMRQALTARHYTSPPVTARPRTPRAHARNPTHATRARTHAARRTHPRVRRRRPPASFSSSASRARASPHSAALSSGDSSAAASRRTTPRGATTFRPCRWTRSEATRRRAERSSRTSAARGCFGNHITVSVALSYVDASRKTSFGTMSNVLVPKSSTNLRKIAQSCPSQSPAAPAPPLRAQASARARCSLR